LKEDEIIGMARQAGMAYEEKLEVYVANIDDLQDFAKLVAEKEREENAQIAETAADFLQNSTFEGVAKAIRARGQA
jgi:hypothetical protein